MGSAQPARRPLTPLAFLQRAASMFAGRVAVVDGDTQLTYAELAQSAARQAAALRGHGVEAGDRVAVLAPNGRALLEAHYGVPLAGAVLVALNHRLTATELDHIVSHAGARLLIFDPAYAELANGIHATERVSTTDLLTEQESLEPLLPPTVDEDALLALNYTSGTTGRPKGVMYHHRGAYVQALAMVHHARLGPSSVHLWTLPMFHCNGWCFTWAVTAAGGTHLCLRHVDPDRVWRHLRRDGVTHLNAAPTVLGMVAWHPEADKGPPPQRVRIGTGGAPPSPKLLERADRLNAEVTHLYGLTETFGPAVACDWQPEWSKLPAAERARLAARQGNVNVAGGELRVVDPSGVPVAPTGELIGEVQLRGSNVMLGYFRDPDATAAAFADGGWLCTGDLAVMHPDGYIELRDRAKDMIISGGENIASIEVEQAIATHPAVLEVAVIGVPDERWGEAPSAHVALKAGHDVSVDEIRSHVRTQLGGFKVPRHVVFGELPKTSTGKIKKFVLREAASRDLPRCGG